MNILRCSCYSNVLYFGLITRCQGINDVFLISAYVFFKFIQSQFVISVAILFGTSDDGATPPDAVHSLESHFTGSLGFRARVSVIMHCTGQVCGRLSHDPNRYPANDNRNILFSNTRRVARQPGSLLDIPKPDDCYQHRFRILAT